MKPDALLNLLEAKRRFHLKGNGQDKAGASQSAYRCYEKFGPFMAGTEYARSIREQQRKPHHMRGYNAIVDTSSVGRGGDDAAQSLVGYRADIDHRKTVICEFDMQCTEGDTSLSDYISFICMDLKTEDQHQYCAPTCANDKPHDMFQTLQYWGLGIANKVQPNKPNEAYLQKPVQLGSPQHIAGGAGEVAWTMTHSDCSDNSAFASSKLKNELAVVLCLWLEYGEWGTSERLTPVGELGRDNNWLEQAIELFEINGRKLSYRYKRRHCRNGLRGERAMKNVKPL